jgi:hypothetical protein
MQEFDRHVFKHKGHPLMDADFWARKSVILNRINVGVGIIDLYSTHLHSGGDIPDLQIIDNVPSDDLKHNVRIAQCKEIVDFIKKSHDPTHIAILVGDFNINANDVPKYVDLMDTMMAANMFDLWPIQYGGTATGMTNGDFNENCAGAGSTTVCDEKSTPIPPTTGSRIDYVFVEAPTAAHTFNLDITVIQRRPFKRPVATEGEQFMSDHIGLSIGLISSPIV